MMRFTAYGRPCAGKPGIDPENTDGSASSLRAQKFYSANSNGSAGPRLGHRFIQLCIRKEALEADILLLQLLETFGFVYS